MDQGEISRLKCGWVNEKAGMIKNWLDIREYNGQGYKPLIDFKTWRVAVLRWEPASLPLNITSLERHTQTDEVFVLLHGKAMLILGGNSNQVEDILPQELEPGKLYNVKQSVWHTVLLSRDGSILIVENRDTGQGNTEYCQLSAGLRQQIMAIEWAE